MLAATGQGVTWWLPVLAGALLLVGIAAFVFVRLARRKNEPKIAAAQPEQPAQPEVGPSDPQ